MGNSTPSGRGYSGMNLTELALLFNSPVLAGIFWWIIKIEKQLTKIETTCKDRKKRQLCIDENDRED
jgi:hypothetical protein